MVSVDSVDRGSSFLVVEDDDILARALARRLLIYGEVQVAGSVDAARKFLQSHAYGGLVLDVLLPDGSGLDLLQALRSSGDRTPALVLTGLHHDELVNRAQLLSAHFAFKPLTAGGIEAFAEWALARNREHASSEAALARARADWSRAPEEQLRRLARAFEAVPVGVMFASADARIELVNQAFCALTGYSPDELRGRDVAILRPDDHDRRVYEELKAVLDRGEPVVREYRRRRKDGSSYLARVAISPIVGTDRRVESHVEVHEDVSAQAAARETLLRGEARSRELLHRTFDAQEAERRRLARDLHDGVGQRLTSLLLGLTRLEQSCRESELLEQVRELREQVRSTMDELSAQVRGMHPRALEDFGFAEVARRMVPEFAELHGLAARLEIVGDEARLPRPVETTLYRVLQEALTNVSRHARARSVQVRVEIDDRHARLVVADDGRGFDPDRLPGQGLGLQSIRERAELHGGSFEVGSGRGGTRIVMQLPIGRSEA